MEKQKSFMTKDSCQYNYNRH